MAATLPLTARSRPSLDISRNARRQCLRMVQGLQDNGTQQPRPDGDALSFGVSGLPYRKAGTTGVSDIKRQAWARHSACAHGSRAGTGGN